MSFLLVRVYVFRIRVRPICSQECCRDVITHKIMISIVIQFLTVPMTPSCRDPSRAKVAMEENQDQALAALTDAAETPAAKELVAPNMQAALGSLAAPEREAEQPAKKRRKGKDKDRSPSPAATARSSTKGAASTTGACACEADEALKSELSEKDPELDAVWKKFVKIKGYEPKSLLALSPAEHLLGDHGNDGRALEGAPWLQATSIVLKG